MSSYLDYEFKSSDENVVIVNAYGELEARGVGVALITVATGDGKIATCEVVVKGTNENDGFIEVVPELEVESISFGETEITINVGESKYLVYNLMPTTAQTQIIWSSSNVKKAFIKYK